MTNRKVCVKVLPAAFIVWGLASCALAWPVPFMKVKAAEDYREAWGLNPVRERAEFARNDILQAYLVTSSVPANILWPGDAPRFTFQFQNLTDRRQELEVVARLVQYQVVTRPGVDIFDIGLRKVRDLGRLPVHLAIDAKGWQEIAVTPEVPDAFGGYALIFDMPGQDSLFGATCVRTFQPDPRARRFHRLCLDMPEIATLRRLGAAPNRIGIGYKPTTDADFETWYTNTTAYLSELRSAGLPVCIEFGGGAPLHPCQPLGRPRPWLDPDGLMLNTKSDYAWMPSYDADFKKLVKRLLSEYGWPRGPVNAVKLWNEPWEGISISGWGADMMRYREIFRALGEARDEAASESGIQVLVGGCDSTANTLDKLFADGKTDFLKWLDFVSIHYQGTDPGTTLRLWLERKDGAGRPAPARVWDTESWVANSDDRIAGALAAMVSFGQERVVGIQSERVVVGVQRREVRRADGGRERRTVLQAWSPAAAVGAFQHFIGERPFREVLFRNGLPVIMVFDGEPDAAGRIDPEDGTLVVLGDMGGIFGRDEVIFRSCRRMEGREAVMEIAADPGYALYDFYGNAIPSSGARIAIPLDARGFYLRGNGRPGSFERLLAALRRGHVSGLEPLAVQCGDLDARVARHPAFRLRLTNIRNEPVTGRLSLSLAGLDLDYPRDLAFAAQETRDVPVQVTGGVERADNLYPLHLVFDAGDVGRTTHDEALRVNVVHHRTITVDGDLNDWKDAVPQPARTEGATSATLAEKAWLPFMPFEQGLSNGVAFGYLAYDETNFYVAVKTSDTTPDGGTLRFETRDDERYFYPPTAFLSQTNSSQPRRLALAWPEGVRRYSYRSRPVLPCGNAPCFDNVQIAFNVLPPEAKRVVACPPGTMPGYIAGQCTDYEYALNRVAECYGGGYEVWRLRSPGQPLKHFYPRQPASGLDGPVRDARLAVTADRGTRIVECAIPWSEIPDVKRRLDERAAVKFSFRVNDSAGNACLELARGRSVSRRQSSAFSAGWTEHWANEVEFVFEP